MNKETLKYFNMKELSNESGVPYNVLKNYSIGRTKKLSKENEIKLFNTIQKILINF